ncbi:hypothetical protein D1872_321920 [compost metagenome]
MPGTTGKQRGFGHAITLPRRQRIAATQGLRIATEGVGVVAHRLTYRVIKIDRPLERIAAGTPMLFGELHHCRVVTIDEAAGTQILAHDDNLLGEPRV